ncbi:ABC transporter ATP-binding protein [Chloroflexus aurantiacus]
MSHPILVTEHLRIGYANRRGETRVVADQLNLTLNKGDVVCLLGPNGIGKSTLLRTLTGMQPPLAGRVLLDGINLATLKPQDIARRVSVVLTERIEANQLSVYHLVALGRYPYTNWIGKLTPHDEEVIQRALSAVYAEQLASRFVHELSDGERQRVMVARALAQEPHVMVLDEPTAFLDLPRRIEMMRLLRRLAHDLQQAIILSIHDLDLALRTADVLWLMTPDGKIQAGAPEDLVLNGAFEKAFAYNHIVFDRFHGQFRLHEPPLRYAVLIGDGLIRKWTVHALERAGYQCSYTDDTVALHITIQGNEQDPHWHIRLNGQTVKHVHSLRDLVTFLRQTPHAHQSQETSNGNSEPIFHR